MCLCTCLSNLYTGTALFDYRCYKVYKVLIKFVSFTNFRRVNRCYGDYMRLLAWQIFSNPMKFLLRLSESLTRKSVQPNSWGVWSPCQHIRWLAFVFCVSATVTDQFGHTCVINICNRAIKLQNCSLELPFLNFWP